MRRIIFISILIVSALFLQLVARTEHIAAQSLVNVKWILDEIHVNPSGVVARNVSDCRVTVSGREISAKDVMVTETTSGSISYTWHREDLEGKELWLQSFSFDFLPPPSEFSTGEKFQIKVNGNAVWKKQAEGTSGPANCIGGVSIGSGNADIKGNFTSRPNDEFFEVGNRTNYTGSLEVPWTGRAASAPIEDRRFRIEIKTGLEFVTDTGNKGPLIIAWIYKATELEDAPETSPPSTTTIAQPEPKKDPGEEALDILGRIGREVARERIQSELKGSLDGIRELLTDTWESYTGWVEGLLDDPIAWVEGPLLDEFGDDFGSEKPENIGLSWDEINEQLGKRIRPVAGVNEESMDELFDKVKNILWEEDPNTERYQPRRTTSFDTVDIKLNRGGSIKIGILVTPEGRIMYTPNGKDYYPDLQRAVDPSLYEGAVDLYTDTKKWIWDSLFTGSTRNPDIDLQNKVASEVLEDLRVQLNAGETPQTVVDWTESKLWSSQIQEPLETKMRQMLWQQAEEALKNHVTGDGKIPSKANLEYLEIFKDMKFQFEGGEVTTPKAWTEFRSQTGIDLFDLTEAGQYAVTGAQFAVESVKTMARGLQDTDFALRTRAYIEERKAGYDIELIYELMRDGKLPELDIGAAKLASGGVSSLMASSGIAAEAQIGVMFSMFEQAYQRYLLARQMGRQP